MTDNINARIRSSNKTVTTSAAVLVATDLPGRKAVMISNEGSSKIYIGHSGVTSDNGTPIASGASKGFDFGESVPIYAITASGTADVRILEGA